MGVTSVQGMVLGSVTRVSGLVDSAAAYRGPSRATSGVSGRPVSVSQTRAVPSQDAVRMREPSGLKAADETGPSCLNGGVSGWPVRASQTRAVLSSDAVTMREPSGLKAA